MPRPNQDREKTSLWVKRSALVEVDEAAAVEGIARSEMLRRRVIGVVDAVWPDGQARIVVDERVEGLYAESEIEQVDG